jgi:hypothetical protein
MIFTPVAYHKTRFSMAGAISIPAHSLETLTELDTTTLSRKDADTYHRDYVVLFDPTGIFPIGNGFSKVSFKCSLHHGVWPEGMRVQYRDGTVYTVGKAYSTWKKGRPLYSLVQEEQEPHGNTSTCP